MVGTARIGSRTVLGVSCIRDMGFAGGRSPQWLFPIRNIYLVRPEYLRIEGIHCHFTLKEVVISLW